MNEILNFAEETERNWPSKTIEIMFLMMIIIVDTCVSCNILQSRSNLMRENEAKPIQREVILIDLRVARMWRLHVCLCVIHTVYSHYSRARQPHSRFQRASRASAKINIKSNYTRCSYFLRRPDRIIIIGNRTFILNAFVKHVRNLCELGASVHCHCLWVYVK